MFENTKLVNADSLSKIEYYTAMPYNICDGIH